MKHLMNRRMIDEMAEVFVPDVPALGSPTLDEICEFVQFAFSPKIVEGSELVSIRDVFIDTLKAKRVYDSDPSRALKQWAKVTGSYALISAEAATIDLESLTSQYQEGNVDPIQSLETIEEVLRCSALRPSPSADFFEEQWLEAHARIFGSDDNSEQYQKKFLKVTRSETSLHGARGKRLTLKLLERVQAQNSLCKSVEIRLRY